MRSRTYFRDTLIVTIVLERLILYEMRFNPNKVRLHMKSLGKLEFYEFFWIVQCLVQPEVKNIILVESSLCEVRFNPQEARLRWDLKSQQSDCSLLHFCHPQTKLRENNVFTGVCQSFCSRGGGTWDTTGYGWQVGSTHPTGMHSCLNIKQTRRWFGKWKLVKVAALHLC